MHDLRSGLAALRSQVDDPGPQLTGGTSETTALLGQLTGLLNDLKQVRTVGAENGINPQEMMLFMMLMQQRNAQPQATVVQAAPTSWAGLWKY